MVDVARCWQESFLFVLVVISSFRIKLVVCLLHSGPVPQYWTRVDARLLVDFITFMLLSSIGFILSSLSLPRCCSVHSRMLSVRLHVRWLKMC